MSKRTIEAYERVFQYINENLIPLCGEAIIIDFEKAMRKALINVLKSIDSLMFILGCWFHFCQALRRKVSQMPALFAIIRKDVRYKDIFRQFQCLPLLPMHHIEDTFRDLAKDALSLDQNLFAPFVDYFHKEWIRTVKPKHFCVYKRDTRTTGAAESCNGKLNQIFKMHPSFFNFCETLQAVETSSSTQLMNYIDGTQQKCKKDSFYQKRSKLIKELSRKHSENPKLLLKMLANVKNKILYTEDDFSVSIKNELEIDIELYGNEDHIVYEEVADSDESDGEIHDDGEHNIPSSSTDVQTIRETATRTRSRKATASSVDKNVTKARKTQSLAAADVTIPEFQVSDKLFFSDNDDNEIDEGIYLLSFRFVSQ